MTSWRAERREVDRIERMAVERLAEDDRGVQIVDVREESEWAEGHIPGSLHVPYHDIHALPEGLDAGRPVAAVCASGQRSATAASLLARYGAREVIHVVDGGVPLWGRLGHPHRTRYVELSCRRPRRPAGPPARSPARR